VRLPRLSGRPLGGRKAFASVKFELISTITNVETIASGTGLRDRRRLSRLYGRGNWRKMKGRATVRLSDGTICDAEIHWYEAHGIGKKELKFKKPLNIR